MEQATEMRGGERLLDFAEENNLVIRNSFFLKAANRYWTWEAPGV